MSVATTLIAFLPNPFDWVADRIADGAKKVFEFFLKRFAEALANAANKVVTEVMNYLDRSSGVALTEGWFASPRTKEILGTVAVFASALILLFLLIAIVQGVVAGDVGLMLRSAALEVPASILGMVALTTVTGVLLLAVDGASSAVLATAPDNLARFLSFGDAAGILKLGLLGFIMVPAFILGAILVWIELVVRSSLIYLLVAFSPVILAARVWPMLRGAWHHFVRIGLALIVAKFAIALSLGLGASALAGGGPGNLGASGPNPNDTGSQVGLTMQGLVVGSSLMVLAAMSPFVVLKLLPVFEAAIVAQGISRGPARAGQTAMQTTYYAQGLKRLAGGSGSGAPQPAAAGAPGGGATGGRTPGRGAAGSGAAGSGGTGPAASGATGAGAAATGVGAAVAVGAAAARTPGRVAGRAEAATAEVGGSSTAPVGLNGQRRPSGESK